MSDVRERALQVAQALEKFAQDAPVSGGGTGLSSAFGLSLLAMAKHAREKTAFGPLEAFLASSLLAGGGMAGLSALKKLAPSVGKALSEFGEAKMTRSQALKDVALQFAGDPAAAMKAHPELAPFETHYQKKLKDALDEQMKLKVDPAKALEDLRYQNRLLGGGVVGGLLGGRYLLGPGQPQQQPVISGPPMIRYG